MRLRRINLTVMRNFANTSSCPRQVHPLFHFSSFTLLRTRSPIIPAFQHSNRTTWRLSTGCERTELSSNLDSIIARHVCHWQNSENAIFRLGYLRGCPATPCFIPPMLGFVFKIPPFGLLSYPCFVEHLEETETGGHWLSVLFNCLVTFKSWGLIVL